MENSHATHQSFVSNICKGDVAKSQKCVCVCVLVVRGSVQQAKQGERRMGKREELLEQEQTPIATLCFTPYEGARPP
eukprot:4551682-Amphidinium_carterae.1